MNGFIPVSVDAMKSFFITTGIGANRVDFEILADASESG
jgi:hypothetical protein